MTSSLKQIFCIVGTRPEVIKMVPVVLALRRTDWAEPYLLSTGQHRDLLKQAFKSFEIQPNIDLGLMLPESSLIQLIAQMITNLEHCFRKQRPDFILAQGDTATVLATALAAHYTSFPFGHIEAGLRTGNLEEPFPEEANRCIADRLATMMFAPTAIAKQNLLNEGLDPKKIHVVGNTVIDALLSVRKQLQNGAIHPQFQLAPDKRYLLLTAHRREHFGEPLQQIALAALDLIRNNSDLEIIYILHPNPQSSKAARDLLINQSQIHLIQPPDYVQLVTLMNSVDLIMTDSGGLQEEAPALGKPVIVLRQHTERLEPIEAGVAKLVGTNRETIVRETEAILNNTSVYQAMAHPIFPYGDGHAAERIVQILKQTLT